MPDITKELNEILRKGSSSPFLFLGSGFSRRYINLEQWAELLKTFCDGLKDYDYYSASCSKDLPSIASMIASDFHEYWWTSDKFKESRKKNKSISINKSSALKIEISKYLDEKCFDALLDPRNPVEIDALKKINVDGIITTNWDNFIDQIFPDYKVYIGQDELLFSKPQEVGEIYKIHGCTSNPNSLVLTKEDYDLFESKNAYLASKLITLFVEHIIVFIGYSLNDSHILKLLSSIVNCLGDEHIKSLQNNLVFIQRSRNGERSIESTFLQINKSPIPITIVKTSDFSEIYNSISGLRRKIPVRLLRHFKEQLFELIQNNDPNDRLAVLNLEELEDNDAIEFVVGIGIKDELLEKGYSGLSAIDVFRNVIFDEKMLHCKKLLQKILPQLLKKSKFIPIYRYLNAVGIQGYGQYSETGYLLNKSVDLSIDEYQSKLYRSYFRNNAKQMTASQIIQNFEPDKAAILIPFVAPNKIDLDEVQAFLKINFDNIDHEKSHYATYFRKLACLYDRLKYGWFK